MAVWASIHQKSPKIRPRVRKAPDPNHPSRKHDIARAEISLTPSSDVQGPVLGQPRRRDRRAALRGTP